MDDLSRTRTEPICGVVEPSSNLLAHPASSPPSSGRSSSGRACCVCGAVFYPRRPEARACSGRCRMAASRGRRVAELVARIGASEVRIADCEQALGLAREALAALKELAVAGSSRVMP